jgi:hypothetical protein
MQTSANGRGADHEGATPRRRERGERIGWTRSSGASAAVDHQAPNDEASGSSQRRNGRRAAAGRRTSPRTRTSPGRGTTTVPSWQKSRPWVWSTPHPSGQRGSAGKKIATRRPAAARRSPRTRPIICRRAACLIPVSTSRPYYGRAAQQHPLEPSPAQGTETPVLWSRSTATASCSFLSHSASFTGLLTDASAQARNPHLPVTAPGESGASHRQQGNSRGPNRPPDASLAPLFLHGALKIVIDAEGV